MNQKEYSKLTNEELLEASKKVKPKPQIHAIFIGLIIGILIFSVAKNGLGFFSLILVFFAYRFLTKTQKN